MLLATSVESSTDITSTGPLSMTERIALGKRKRMAKEEAYMNCNFILGSVAEVDRLWSVPKNILSRKRKHMTPLVFEAVLFLKG